MRLKEVNTLTVDFQDVYNFNEELAMVIRDQYYRLEPFLRKVVQSFVRSVDESMVVSDTGKEVSPHAHQPLLTRPRLLDSQPPAHPPPPLLPAPPSHRTSSTSALSTFSTAPSPATSPRPPSAT